MPHRDAFHLRPLRPAIPAEKHQSHAFDSDAHPNTFFRALARSPNDDSDDEAQGDSAGEEGDESEEDDAGNDGDQGDEDHDFVLNGAGDGVGGAAVDMRDFDLSDSPASDLDIDALPVPAAVAGADIQHEAAFWKRPAHPPPPGGPAANSQAFRAGAAAVIDGAFDMDEIRNAVRNLDDYEGGDPSDSSDLGDNISSDDEAEGNDLYVVSVAEIQHAEAAARQGDAAEATDLFKKFGDDTVFDLPSCNRDEVGEPVRLTPENIHVSTSIFLDYFMIIGEINKPLYQPYARQVGTHLLQPNAAGRVVSVKSYEYVFKRGSVAIGLGDVPTGRLTMIIQPISERNKATEWDNKLPTVSSAWIQVAHRGIAYILHHSASAGTGAGVSFMDHATTGNEIPFNEAAHTFDRPLDLSPTALYSLQDAIAEQWYTLFDPYLRDARYFDERQTEVRFMVHRYGQNRMISLDKDNAARDFVVFLSDFEPSWSQLRAQIKGEHINLPAGTKVSLLGHLPTFQHQLGPRARKFPLAFSREHGNVQSPTVLPFIRSRIASINEHARSTFNTQIAAVSAVSTNSYSEIKTVFRAVSFLFLVGSGIFTAALAFAGHALRPHKGATEKVEKGRVDDELQAQYHQLRQQEQHGFRQEHMFSFAPLPADVLDNVGSAQGRTTWEVFASHVLVPTAHAPLDDLAACLDPLDAFLPKVFPGVLVSLLTVIGSWVRPIVQRWRDSRQTPTLAEREVIDTADRLSRGLVTGARKYPTRAWATWGHGPSLKRFNWPVFDFSHFNPATAFVNAATWPTSAVKGAPGAVTVAGAMFPHETAIRFWYGAEFALVAHAENQAELLMAKNTKGKHRGKPAELDVMALLEWVVREPFSQCIAAQVQHGNDLALPLLDLHYGADTRNFKDLPPQEQQACFDEALEIYAAQKRSDLGAVEDDDHDQHFERLASARHDVLTLTTGAATRAAGRTTYVHAADLARAIVHHAFAGQPCLEEPYMRTATPIRWRNGGKKLPAWVASFVKIVEQFFDAHTNVVKYPLALLPNMLELAIARQVHVFPVPKSGSRVGFEPQRWLEAAPPLRTALRTAEDDSSEVIRPYRNQCEKFLSQATQKLVLVPRPRNGSASAANKAHQAASLDVEVWQLYLAALNNFDPANETHQAVALLAYLWTFRWWSPPRLPTKSYIAWHAPYPSLETGKRGSLDPAIMRGAFITIALVVSNHRTRKLLAGRDDLLKRIFVKQEHRGLNWKLLRRFGLGQFTDKRLEGTFGCRHFSASISQWDPTSADNLADVLRGAVKRWKKGNWASILRLVYSSADIDEFGELPLAEDVPSTAHPRSSSSS
ncbi:hypothetical protein Rhopal_002939-T1 [Rhodotorula paludigena]|uniref:Uncharacterized protein n=1 Tax=Rhodotorula paludigena TaxID=86838 RepID=A0AAV5GJD6_9BASI|nr:hypothetical protein Rhopal_002939-T1 [Rhodotorula paludigena]